MFSFYWLSHSSPIDTRNDVGKNAISLLRQKGKHVTVEMFAGISRYFHTWNALLSIPKIYLWKYQNSVGSDRNCMFLHSPPPPPPRTRSPLNKLWIFYVAALTWILQSPSLYFKNVMTTHIIIMSSCPVYIVLGWNLGLIHVKPVPQ